MTKVFDTREVDQSLSIAEQMKQVAPDMKVFEVTIKRVHLIPKGSHIDKEVIEKEWYGTHIHRTHASRDSLQVGNGDQLVEVKEIK